MPPCDRTSSTAGHLLCLAVGISRAVEHLAGVKGARTVVAVHRAPRRPHFGVSDYAIVGDRFEIVPALTQKRGQ